MLKKGLVEFNLAQLTVSLAPGDRVPCPKCRDHHTVQSDPRPGECWNITTGCVDQVPNDVLFIECPEVKGPIIVGIEGKALPNALELTPRPKK